ncbi:MAG: BACON domain-containing protein [Bifidobacteriaceae bacterium]|jgi:hypothetical protein|nr:BACON domain-containing protein [Bifidobacteriaceae bacterium]
MGTLEKVFKVTQAAPAFSVSRTSWSPSKSGEAGAVQVKTDLPNWRASSDADWLTISPTSGSGGSWMAWVALANPGAKRTANVTVEAGDLTAAQVAPLCHHRISDDGDRPAGRCRWARRMS